MTPGAQAAKEAFITGCVRRGILAVQVVTGSAADAAGVWEETAQAAVAAERDRIIALADSVKAVATTDEGIQCYFADLLRERP